jgi:hypothetical protein
MQSADSNFPELLVLELTHPLMHPVCVPRCTLHTCTVRDWLPGRGMAQAGSPRRWSDLKILISPVAHSTLRTPHCAPASTRVKSSAAKPPKSAFLLLNTNPHQPPQKPGPSPSISYPSARRLRNGVCQSPRHLETDSAPSGPATVY